MRLTDAQIRCLLRSLLIGCACRGYDLCAALPQFGSLGLSGGNVLLLELLECLLGFGIEFLQLIQLFRLRLALLAQFVDGVLKLFPQSRQSGFRNRLPAYRALNARF